jgi:uncharacterized membrane protein YkoI
MKTFLIAATLILAPAAALAAPTAAKPYAGHELAGQAHVDLAKATAIALKARPGTITDRELEKEAGGSGLRWSFDVKAGGKAYEVGVDAATGAVLENKAEGAHPD